MFDTTRQHKDKTTYRFGQYTVIYFYKFTLIYN